MANRRRDRDPVTFHGCQLMPRAYRWDRVIAPLAAAIALAMIATRLL